MFKDFDVSSISGSDDDDEDRTGGFHKATSGGVVEGSKRKLYLHLHTGGTVSVWRNLIMDESQRIAFENDKPVFFESDVPHLTEGEVIEKLNSLIHEPRDNTHFMIVLLVRGGHFAGCVFDGNSVVTHKTFHRCVLLFHLASLQLSDVEKTILLGFFNIFLPIYNREIVSKVHLKFYILLIYLIIRVYRCKFHFKIVVCTHSRVVGHFYINFIFLYNFNDLVYYPFVLKK